MSPKYLKHLREHKKLKQLRRRAFVNQNCLCFYCQLPMWEDKLETFAVNHGVPTTLAIHLKCTAEHLIARQDKGRDSPENVVASCLWCNASRHLGRSNTAPDPISYKTSIRDAIAKGLWHPVIINNEMACQQVLSQPC